ncbi:hypothetical protein LSTR_LSTR013449 [Laodelphax striatellus]|uniref:Protein-tyrosine-phosphatase n=1 Tax=Laodelphax striatellus TaxID=195883 RepID=A0A482WWJ9_LAOST|nr:hypothetical protein LSTR_LSTR013449 [Laodelphax striatellus]
MSLLEQINKQKTKLSHTETMVKTADGKTVCENFVGNTFTSNQVSVSHAGYVVDLKPDLQVAKITENLFLGSQDVALDQNLLVLNNITHVISLGIPVTHFPNIGCTYVNVLDLPEFDIRRVFDEVFEVINEVIDKKGKVFVHCNAGVSRSASVVIGYLMRTFRLGFEEAYEMVKAQRSCIRPNEGFVRQLKEYEKLINIEGE